MNLKNQLNVQGHAIGNAIPGLGGFRQVFGGVVANLSAAGFLKNTPLDFYSEEKRTTGRTGLHVWGAVNTVAGLFNIAKTVPVLAVMDHAHSFLAAAHIAASHRPQLIEAAVVSYAASVLSHPLTYLVDRVANSGAHDLSGLREIFHKHEPKKVAVPDEQPQLSVIGSGHERN